MATDSTNNGPLTTDSGQSSVAAGDRDPRAEIGSCNRLDEQLTTDH
ncbi:MAG: hypothetical protein WD066_18635 [Planctomycetaceae bacterium]